MISMSLLILMVDKTAKFQETIAECMNVFIMDNQGNSKLGHIDPKG